MLHATIEALSFAPSKMVALHNSTTKKCHAMPNAAGS
ncbi:uncharacterized protein FFB14_07708 [Fusarium fujikuroi]|nr:uncharacterized protein FFB14_07708 [Fusarium fujikuroi]